MKSLYTENTYAYEIDGYDHSIFKCVIFDLRSYLVEKTILQVNILLMFAVEILQGSIQVPLIDSRVKVPQELIDKYSFIR